MSRSRKKTGIIKDNGYPKYLYNRKYRRVNKIRIRLGKEPKRLGELVNGYCICDYKFYWSEKAYYWFGIQDETEEEYMKRRRQYFGK